MFLYMSVVSFGVTRVEPNADGEVVDPVVLKPVEKFGVVEEDSDHGSPMPHGDLDVVLEVPDNVVEVAVGDAAVSVGVYPLHHPWHVLPVRGTTLDTVKCRENREHSEVLRLCKLRWVVGVWFFGNDG